MQLRWRSADDARVSHRALADVPAEEQLLERAKAMNRREHDLIDKLVKALQTARRYVEPHPSWESEQRHKEALEAIHSAVGPSDEFKTGSKQSN
jgi:hypothetical protein